MSYTIIDNEAFDNENLKPNQKLVLLMLLRHKNNEKGYAYPSQAMLLKKTGLSKNTLLKCLSELEEKGYIQKQKTTGVNNKYYINTSIKNDTTENDTSIKNDTGTSIKNDTGGSIKIDTLQILNKNTNKNTNIYNDLINAYTENQDLVKAIYSFIDMRKKIKKPMTENALDLMLKKLDRLGNNDLEKIEILENSIMNSWQGIFELKNKKAPSGIGTQNKNNLVNPSICNSRRKYTQACDIG